MAISIENSGSIAATRMVKKGAKAVYRKYTLPYDSRKTGYFHLGLQLDSKIIRVPCLSGISRKHLRLPYPPHPYLFDQRKTVLLYPGTTDEHWWDRPHWSGYEGKRTGQHRLRATVLARDKICQICRAKPATEAHHIPPWREHKQHNPNKQWGYVLLVISKLVSVVKSNEELR